MHTARFGYFVLHEIPSSARRGRTGAFLTVRQELKRFQRKGLGYSKDLATHKHATALFLGVYNFVRKHKTLGTSPAVAAGIEEKPWTLERVVEMTAEYCRRKEDAVFEEAFAEALGC